MVPSSQLDSPSSETRASIMEAAVKEASSREASVERIEMVRRAQDFCDYVDIELRAPLRDEIMKRVDKPFIVSYHDFDGILDIDEMRSILEEMRSPERLLPR